jgi:hypothetical protein
MYVLQNHLRVADAVLAARIRVRGRKQWRERDREDYLTHVTLPGVSHGVHVQLRPLADNVACATTSDSNPASGLDLNLDFDVPTGLTDSHADADAGTDDGVVVPSPTPPPPHFVLRFLGPRDGPMLSFVMPEHDDPDSDPDSDLNVGTSPRPHSRAPGPRL